MNVAYKYYLGLCYMELTIPRSRASILTNVYDLFDNSEAIIFFLVDYTIKWA